MRFLLDTHCWLWWLSAPERLGDAARVLIEDGKNDVVLSAVSSWEMAIKVALGKLTLPDDPERLVPAQLRADGFSVLPIHHAHALRVANLPHHHRDPFDRLLVAQSQVEGLPILTADSKLSRYEVEIIPAMK